MRPSIAKLLNTANSLGQATKILVITAMASNILGLVRNTVIAKNIPLAQQDNFWSAFLLPDIVFNVLIFGAIAAAFIPLFKALLVKGEKEQAWELAGSFLAKVSLLVITLSVVLFIFMSPLISIIFPALEPVKMAEVTLLSRILLLQTILIGWSYIVGGILNAKKRFFAYSMAPLIYNISIIVGAFAAPYFGERGVTVLIWFVVLGAALHLAIQLPSVFAVGFRWRYLNLRANELTREIVILMTPRSISLGVISMNAIVFAAIARNLMMPGALSIYRLVESFQTAPIAIFANAIAVALFPTLTEYATREDWQKFAKSLERAIRFILFTLIPSTVIFIVLRAQIIRLYIGLGSSISWDETINAINTFGWFAIGIVPAGLVAIFARAFYALKNTLLPMIIALFTLVFGVATAYTLAITTTFGATALAIATSAATLVQFILLYLAYLRLVRKPLPENRIIKTGFFTTLASIGMAGIMWWSLRLMHYLYENVFTTLSTRIVEGLLLQFIVSLSLGLIAFYLIALVWLSEELLWLKRAKQQL